MRAISAKTREGASAARASPGAGATVCRETAARSAADGPRLITVGAAGRAAVDAIALMSVQRSAGNRATCEMVRGTHPGATAAGRHVQRAVDPDAQTWLTELLSARGGDLATQLENEPAERLLAMNEGDRMDTVASVRGLVPDFEEAVTASPGLGDLNACRMVSALEDAHVTEDLGLRLLVMFHTSTDPLLGLASLITIPMERVRAALQASPAAAREGLTRLAGRLLDVAIPEHLTWWNDFLTTLRQELAAPTTAGVTGSSEERERDVTRLLTPPEVAAARAEAAARGEEPPAFVEEGYYDDLMTALHAVATASWRRADEVNRRAPMDMTGGGRVEQVAGEAKRRVDALFGQFGSAAAPRLTINVNLFDQSARAGNAWDMARWFIEDSGREAISTVSNQHNAFGVARASEIRADVIDHYSNTEPRSGHAAPADLDARLGIAAAERKERLLLTDRMWPGMAGGGRVYLTPREGGTPEETRHLYWNLFKTCVHEYLHTTANAGYTRWYEGLQDPHHKVTFQEGFTDLFTRQTWRSVYPEEVAGNTEFRQTVQSSPEVDMAAARGDPPAYPEIEEAANMEMVIGLSNMRAAYFRGNTAVLGAGGLPRR